jgi:transcriptional regulator with XRE-family HTH domain
MSESNAPFTTLGKHLKYVRQQLDQSLAEVSGAVEIEENRLERIEAGEERPTEDILLLLISHFGMQEQQAVQLWELADYGDELPDHIKQDADQVISKSVVMLLAMDTRAIYSDGVEATVTKAGITLNFTQEGGQASTPVSRVGMSVDQAEEVLRTLQQAILQAKYSHGTKLLPPDTK